VPNDAAHAPARRVYEKVGFTAALPTVTYFCDLEQIAPGPDRAGVADDRA
jgi:hypothetical protein